MVLNGPPPIPIPIPGVSKRLLPGGKQFRKKHMFDDFLLFLIKQIKKIPFQGGLKRGSQLKSTKQYEHFSGRFPERVQREEIQQ